MNNINKMNKTVYEKEYPLSAIRDKMMDQNIMINWHKNYCQQKGLN